MVASLCTHVRPRVVVPTSSTSTWNASPSNSHSHLVSKAYSSFVIALRISVQRDFLVLSPLTAVDIQSSSLLQSPFAPLQRTPVQTFLAFVTLPPPPPAITNVRFFLCFLSLETSHRDQGLQPCWGIYKLVMDSIIFWSQQRIATLLPPESNSWKLRSPASGSFHNHGRNVSLASFLHGHLLSLVSTSLHSNISTLT